MIWGLIVFVGGTILGLFVSRWFVELLPGPHVSFSVLGVRAKSAPNAAGCTFYTFDFKTDQSIDFVDIRLQLPMTITGSQVGYAANKYLPTNGNWSIQAWVPGRNVNDECSIINQSVNNSIDIQNSTSGNLIVAHMSKVDAHTSIMGAVIGPTYSSQITPAPTKPYFEGTYEYTVLGQRVDRPLRMIDEGITDR
jgi:hypothetical protein